MKDYLGDSVYAETAIGGIVLTTENGLPTDPSNRIFLEPEVLDGLNAFASRARRAEAEAEARAIAAEKEAQEGRAAVRDQCLGDVPTDSKP